MIRLGKNKGREYKESGEKNFFPKKEWLKKSVKKIFFTKNKSIETKEQQKCSEVIRDFWKKDKQNKNVVEIWD